MKKNKVILSICIPTYNRKHALERTLDCLIPQCVGKEVEIIVSDNASGDGTKGICLALEEKYDFFRFSRYETNQGFAKNLVSVLSQGQGQYLWMLGDDEIIHPQAISTILHELSLREPSWLVCNFVKLDSEEQSWANKEVFSLELDNSKISLDKLLKKAGVWASFMSISIISSKSFKEWGSVTKEKHTDYVGFDIALFSGRSGGCTILAQPVLARIKTPLLQHRFDKLSVYFFDFFAYVDTLVSQTVVSLSTRNQLAKEMFFSMAGFLLIQAKLKGEPVPSVLHFIKHHFKSGYFWLIVFPILVAPKFLIQGFVKIVSYGVSENSSSRVSRMLYSLKQ